MRLILWLALSALVFSNVALGADRQVVPASDAAQHVGQEVAIEFVVQSARQLESGKFCFLNSHKSFSDKDNFTVAIPGEALPKFSEKGIADPAEHFLKKTIRVKGKVSLYKEKPQIVVAGPEQIATVIEIKR